jgi:hypothetical protein
LYFVSVYQENLGVYDAPYRDSIPFMSRLSIFHYHRLGSIQPKSSSARMAADDKQKREPERDLLPSDRGSTAARISKAARSSGNDLPEVA